MYNCVTQHAHLPAPSQAAIARCAAATAGSLADYTGKYKNNAVVQTFLGNDFSTATNLLLGPNRGTAAFQGAISNPLPFNGTAVVAGAVGSVTVEAGTKVVATSAQTAFGETIYQGVANLVPLAGTAGAKLASKAFVAFSAAKLGYDFLSYGAATLRCGGIIP